MLRKWLMVTAAVLLAASCTTGSSTSDTTSTAVAVETTDPVPADPSVSTVPSSPSDPVPTVVSGPAAVLTAGAGAVVEVSGGVLPDAVTRGVRSEGGEFADTASFDARWETFGLPRIVGPGVVLVAGESIVEAVEGGWSRRDGLQWLFMDISHDGIRSLMDDMAVAAGAAGWPVEETAATVSNGDCVERTYTYAGVEWLLQGCAYPGFPGMYALGVTRLGVFENGPPVVDPTVAPMAAALDGEVTWVSVRFEHPQSTGSTVTLIVQAVVSHTLDGAVAVEAAAAGPLTGWVRQPGDGSVQFAGSLGTRWVVGGGEARLVAEGRLVP